MASMNISMPGPMRDWVQSRVDTGAYAGVSDYVRELIRKDQQAVADRERQRLALDASVDRALADAAAGRVVEVGEALGALRRKYVGMAEPRSRR